MYVVSVKTYDDKSNLMYKKAVIIRSRYGNIIKSIYKYIQ